MKKILRKRFIFKTPTIIFLVNKNKIVIKPMATYKSVQESSEPPACSGLECDICSSEDIVDTKEGYVCRNCGIVLEVQKLQ